MRYFSWGLMRFWIKNQSLGLPWWSSGYESALQCRGHWFIHGSSHATGQLSLCTTTTKPTLWLKSPRPRWRQIEYLVRTHRYFTLCPHRTEGARELSRVFFNKDTNPIHEGSTSLIYFLSKVPPPNIITLLRVRGVRDFNI